MKIRLVSHASVLTRVATFGLWCDPWLFGRAFNDSWSLFPDAAWDPAWLDDVDFLWISHEHPDHFHFPTLRSLPEEWKRRVTVLYQDRASEEIRAALEKMGFAHFRFLPHRRWVALRAGIEVYAYHAKYGDSCLAIRGEGATSLNVNDAQLDEADCAALRADLGPIDVTLKQFSLAGYTGGKEYDTELRDMAQSILWHLANVHRWLGTRVTIPFASFVYFSNRDNAFVNAYVNTPLEARRHLVEDGCSALLLYPGDEYDVGCPHDETQALAKFERDEERRPELPIDAPPLVPLETLQASFATFAADVHDKFTAKRVAVAPPVNIRVPDLGTTLEMSLWDRTLRDVGPAGEPAHLEVCSQALDFGFRARFGFETMAISSRLFVLNDRDWPWILNRDLLWLYRWGIWLRPKWLLSPANLRRVWPWFRENRLNKDAVLGGLRRHLDGMKRRIGYAG